MLISQLTLYDGVNTRTSSTLRSAGAKAGFFSVYRASIQAYAHVAPLGLGLLDMSPVYKHAAPLGLQKKGKRENGADSRLLYLRYTLRSAGAKAGFFSVYRASIQAYAHVAPLERKARHVARL